MPIKQMREIPGTTFFDGPMSTRGYPLNKMFYSLNSEEGREAFRRNEEACMDKYVLNETQKQAVRDRDVLAMIREGGSIYYLAKIGPILNLNVQDFGGLSHQLDGERAGFVNTKFDEECLDKMVSDPEALTQYSIEDVVEIAGAQGVELNMWLGMRGCLRGKVTELHRNLVAPISNTCAGLQLLVNE